MQRAAFLLSVVVLVGGCASGPRPYSAVLAESLRQPEQGSVSTSQAGWQGQKFAVATAHPLASEAGLEMLAAGGSAIDAAVAVQMVLTLVEPQSSGIGGGAFLLYHDGRDTVAFDGRETAPAAVQETLFVAADGQAMPFHEAIVGGRAVGVPGTVRMLEMAHAEYGRLPWKSLFAPAIRLAEQGFPVSDRLHALVAADQHLKKDPQAAAYFYDAAGQPRAAGSLLRNPELADVLRRIAEQGSAALHQGEVARAIVDKVSGHATNPGLLSLGDMAGYRAIRREPLCVRYASQGAPVPRRYRLCGFPPPSSGAIAIAQILGIILDTGAATLAFDDPSWMHAYTEASRLAFADRAQYVADPAFVAAPGGNWHSLLQADYLASRARLIGAQSMRVATPGSPVNAARSHSPMAFQVEYGTSHLSIVDGRGHALAMTTTIEDAFGSRQMVRGFLLNNELSDFSFMPADASGSPVANRVEPGKRPRSSMSPTLVFDDDSGEFVLSGGSPGGAMIIHYTAKLLYATLNWGLSPQQAIDLPNFGSLNGPTILEEGRFPAAFVEALRARAHEVRETALTSGIQAIGRVPAGLAGGADPRREGRVVGE
ncbi:gamma-glutamyltransferase family protein [Accumulibacter sp.]|uniref:gamma-glutamyltransferase family protein n=1 Tax=Accumulibacter sp. TaxID=2053492 RepID=UPI0025DA2F11|nr:gamma-glutamyltransferase family protein [Accumulibacter sp.]MCM8595687.1 gamma-glutamyltransferase family protein [Accumulibacter sp.]MCM8627753.1 gamma-glutamyltransferase family protein [Accumulibacter sp.]MDS4049834.1 gamma-glutamyltransferase family protein [Accumulibacter sp.]